MKVEKEEIMLTTIDNPFDPFTQFDEWFAFDCSKKYYTCSYIDRIVQSLFPNILSTRATEEQSNAAIKEIVMYNPETYKIVRRTTEADTIDLIEI